MLVRDHILSRGLDSLTQAPFHLEARRYPEQGLSVLNYSQSLSPKFDPIVRECRGLVLDEANGYAVVARSFDRFFNHGEERTAPPITSGIALEKIDGSLMTAYHRGRWNVSTRGMAFAEGKARSGRTHAGLFEGVLPLSRLDGLPESVCPVFEMASPETRVVTPYAETAVYLLAVRDRETGSEWPLRDVHALARDLSVRVPATFPLSDLSDVVAAAKGLPRLQEGYVCLWENGGEPFRLKVKNPAYVALAHMRNNGVLSHSRLVRMVLDGEHGEFLSCFPHDGDLVLPYVRAKERILSEAREAFRSAPKGSRREFGLAVGRHPLSGLLFRMLDGDDAEQALSAAKAGYAESLFRDAART